MTANGLAAERSLKPRHLLLSVIGLLLPFLAVACSPSSGEKLYGAWVGDACWLEPRFNYVWNADGTARAFSNATGDPIAECHFTIEKKWTDSRGATWYQLVANDWTWCHSSWYALIRLDPSGNVCESASSTLSRPTEFWGPIGGDGHGIYRRL